VLLEFEFPVAAAGCVCAACETSRGAEEDKSPEGVARSGLYFSGGAVWVVCGHVIDWRRGCAGKTCRTAEQGCGFSLNY
jgi:hypothetical protein